MLQQPSLFLIAAFLILSAFCVEIKGDISNSNVDRTIDLRTHVAKITSDITLHNTGTSSFSTYVFAIPAEYEGHLSYLSAFEGKNKRLPVESVESTKDGFVSYQVKLSTPVTGKQTQKISVVEYYTHMFSPLPKQITQSQDQMMVYEGEMFFASPYPTESETVTVLAAGSIEERTELPGSTADGTKITYHSQSKLIPYTRQPLRIHSISNTPFFSLHNVLREIEISHWGNVAVEEHYDMTHNGAELIGGFSRLRYDRNSKGSSFRNMVAKLPKDAMDPYYRDIIGNISTSNFRAGKKHSILEYKTRFPMYGTWNTSWYWGYNLPSENYLKVDGNRYELRIDFSVPIENPIVDDLTVKVILPEGVTDIAVEAPVPVEISETKRYTYLDTHMGGRPVYILKTRNLVSEHAHLQLRVQYTFKKILMLREPSMIVAVFLCFFLIVIGCGEMSKRLKIGKKDKKD